MENFIIVSVESRKGGVGKTTAALNLAQLFLKKQYAVLFLDVDITGTNAADGLDSPFWSGIASPITFNGGNANLLDVFQTRFMTGHGIPPFSSNEKEDALQINVERVNVFGSQIYDLGGFGNNKISLRNKKSKIICKPSILFDELHAFWFIEFLQEICATFSAAIGDRKVVVIIDNSPGYVGIAPAVQDWLTDLGPVKGKFLTISSLDTQDFISCAHAVEDLHDLFQGKYDVGRKFIESCENDSKTELEIGQSEVPFFERLAELSSNRQSFPNPQITGADLSFYLKGKNEHCHTVEKYQALIINRVPQDVKRGFYEYRNPIIDNLNGTINGLLGRDKREIMVGYDPYIEYQFINSKLLRRREGFSKRQRDFRRIFPRAMERHPLPSNEHINKLLTGREKIGPENIGAIKKYISAANSNVIGIRNIFVQGGFEYLARLIDEDWLPGNILVKLQNAIRYNLVDGHFPYFELEDVYDEDKSGNWEIIKIMERLPESIKRFSREMKLPDEITEPFSPSLIAAISLSVSKSMLMPAREEFVELLGAVIAIETFHWYNKRMPSEVLSVQKFLANDSLGRDELSDMKMKIHIHPRWYEEGNISAFYKACVTAQSRLLDLRQDAEFVIDIMQRMADQEMHEAHVMPYIRGIAEKVIVSKTLTHEAGRKQIIQGFTTIQYMEDFSATLERTLKQWEIHE